LSQYYHITGSVGIFDKRVYKNNKLIFEIGEQEALQFFLQLYEQLNLNYPKFYKMDKLSKLGWLAAEILLADQLLTNNYQPEDIALVLSNKNSSLDTDTKYFESAKTIASPALFVYTLPNIVMGEICIRHQLKGENAFFIFEEFNTAFMLAYCNDLLNTKAAKACICGWVEVLQNDYKAVLILIESRSGKNSVPFTIENINQLYQQTNG
jgi:hypothetical protein